MQSYWLFFQKKVQCLFGGKNRELNSISWSVLRTCGIFALKEKLQCSSMFFFSANIQYLASKSTFTPAELSKASLEGTKLIASVSLWSLKHLPELSGQILLSPCQTHHNSIQPFINQFISESIYIFSFSQHHDSFQTALYIWFLISLRNETEKLVTA